MSFTMTIRTNAAQATAVLLKDTGVVIPGAGGSELIADKASVAAASASEDLRTFCTDDAYGAGSSTLILNDGSGDVAQADVDTFLANAPITIGAGPYGAFGSTASGSPVDAGGTVRTYTAGVALLDPVYQKADGTVDKADASQIATMPALGIVAALDTPNVGECLIVSLGDLTGFVGLTPKAIYIAGTAPGSIIADDDVGNPVYPDVTPGSLNVFQEVGQAKDATTLFVGTNRDFQVIE